MSPPVLLLVGAGLGGLVVHLAWSAYRGLWGWGWLWWLNDVRRQVGLLRWREGRPLPLGTTCLRRGEHTYTGICGTRGGSFVTDDRARVDCPACHKALAR